VPEEDVGLYFAQSADMQALHRVDMTKPIALITHSRMQAQPPSKYVTFPGSGGRKLRQLLFIDEALPPLIILAAPDMLVETFLRRMGLDWQDVGTLSPEETDSCIRRANTDLMRYAERPFRKAGIEYLEWTNYLQESEMTTAIRYHAYYVMFYHILQGQYILDGKINVLIPMAPHLSWMKLFDQILVLDATASLCDYLYTDYPMLTPGTWNYADIQLPLKYYSSLGNLSRTKLATHQELFLQELSDHLVPLILEQGFTDPYVVTYKSLNQASFVEQVAAIFEGTPIQSYGGTRGSNAFREKDSVVLVGSYRPPVEFDALATKLFGAAYHPYKYACAHWIQEVYRTRIRQHQGEPIQLLAIGQREIIDYFEQTVGRFLHPISIGAHETPALIEQILRRDMHTLQRTLLEEVVKKRRAHIKAFADQYAGRDRRKVINAYHGY
jgi:hypothetical protein